jgi:hypothetical protein
MGRQVSKGWRGVLLAYLAQPTRAATAAAVAGLLFDLGTAVVAAIAWELGPRPRHVVPALMALIVSAALCVTAVYVQPRRLREWLAAVGAAIALLVPSTFWPA